MQIGTLSLKSEPDATSEFLRLFVLISIAIDASLAGGYLLFELAEGAGIARSPDKLDIESAGSLLSIWNYGKYFVAAISLATIAVTFPRHGWSFLSALVMILLIDDYAEVHDRIGKALGARLEMPPFESFGQQDRGEPFVYAGLFLLAVSLIILAFRRLPGLHREAARRICVLIFALAAFGVGVDLIHSAIYLVPGPSGTGLNIVTALIEETGESVVLSLLLWKSAWLAIKLISDGREETVIAP